MPNWCSNEINFYAPSYDDILFIKDKIKSGEQFFNNFVPMPTELETTSSPNNLNADEMERKYGAKDWYEWKVKNWGTKWDVGVEVIAEDQNNITIIFDSAWAPPLTFCGNMVERYPQYVITAVWDEPSMGYVGKMVVDKNGVNMNEGLIENILDIKIVYFLAASLDKQPIIINKLHDHFNKMSNYFLKKWKELSLTTKNYNLLQDFECEALDYIDTFLNKLQNKKIIASYDVEKLDLFWDEYTVMLTPCDFNISIQPTVFKKL